MFRKISKIILIILLPVLALYLIVVFSFGGFGKKPDPNLAYAKGDSMLLFAHRGISFYYPEHSIEAANAAKLLGFNAIEIDVRLSADNEFIVFHDEDCQRLTGVKRAADSMKITDLKKYPLLFNSQVTGNYALTVNEFLSSYKNDFVTYFDMKIYSLEIADKIIKLIKKHGAENSCIIAGSDIFFIFYIESKYPEIITALEGFDTGKEWTYALMPKNLKPDFLSGFFQNIDKDHIDWLKKNHLIRSRIVYGIEKSNYNAAKNFGLKNIMLDYDSSMKYIFKNMKDK